MTLSNICTVECVDEKYQKLNVCIWQSTDLPRASLSPLAGHKKSYWQAWQNWSWKRDENWVRVFLLKDYTIIILYVWVSRMGLMMIRLRKKKNVRT